MTSIADKCNRIVDYEIVLGKVAKTMIPKKKIKKNTTKYLVGGENVSLQYYLVNTLFIMMTIVQLEPIAYTISRNYSKIINI